MRKKLKQTRLQQPEINVRPSRPKDKIIYIYRFLIGIVLASGIFNYECEDKRANVHLFIDTCKFSSTFNRIRSNSLNSSKKESANCTNVFSPRNWWITVSEKYISRILMVNQKANAIAPDIPIKRFHANIRTLAKS